jgi:hypothetical protein
MMKTLADFLTLGQFPVAAQISLKPLWKLKSNVLAGSRLNLMLSLKTARCPAK